ncbi:periplasmic binding protein-like I [Paraphysoderma sedebokerense]|nr:periplasmic binding protein-like I [Paraphysoderma sedebokerense]
MTPAVLIAFLAVLCFAHMGLNAQIQIKIGVFLPNTTDFSASKSIWRALTLYAEEVNNSTLLPNATVVLSFKDTQFSKSLAVKDAVNYAKDYNVFATIGEFYSRNTIPSALALNQFKVFQCSGSSTSADLSNKTDYQYFFRTVASDNIQGVVLARYVKFMNWTHVAIITANDEYGLGLAQAFQEEASKLSVTILANVLHTPSSVDLTANILQLKESGARIFLVFSHNDCGPQFPTCGPELLLTAKKNGLIGKDYVWIGAESFYATMDMVRDTSAYQSEYRETVNGMLASFPMENPRTEIANATIDQFRQHYGSEPTPYTLFFRDCLATYVHGIAHLLQQNTSLTLTEILDRANSGIDALQFVGGLTFEGATGTVAFDSNADRSGNYAIINNYNTTEKVVFVYNAITNLFEKLDVLRFYDGTSSVPSGLASIYSIVVSWDDPGVAILVALHLIMILVVVGSVIILYRERDSKVVKSLSLNLVYLIALGILLIYTSIFTSIGVPTEDQCLAQMWVPNNPQMAQLNGLKDRNLLIVSSLLVLIEIVLLTIVTLMDPPRPVTTVLKSLSIQYTSCVQVRPMELNWVINVYNLSVSLFLR